jgi:molecular chaperone DnaK (HSP70)
MGTKATAFGIDFGTTNTRVAYYDGERLRLVPFVLQGVQFYQMPTLVSYANGAVAAVGPEARRQGTLPAKPIKWLLGQVESVEVDGGAREPVEIAADFFRHLRRLVGESIKAEPLTRAAVTIPVHYPPKARQQLQQACALAGIEITHFFFEPIAAIYCSLVANPVSGVTAVFDWGGGSLDIATVQIRDGIALTRQVDGWHRGGTDFDGLICEQALNNFLLANPLAGYTAQLILDRMKPGRDLKLRAETVKIQLSKQAQAALTYGGFLGGKNLSHGVSRADFNDLIEDDVRSGLARLDQALRSSGVTPKILARLFLSGGTCNIPAVRDRLAAEVAGNRMVDGLQLPERLKTPGASGGLDNIGNATAMGAALLAVHAAEPVFASSIGVRLADAGGDQFYAVYKAGETVSFKPKVERLFISDASSGVARLLICDQDDPVRQPGGRLLRIVPIPVHRQENWLDVTFTLDRHLVLRVEATGRKETFRGEPTWVQHLNLGFRIPDGLSTTGRNGPPEKGN